MKLGFRVGDGCLIEAKIGIGRNQLTQSVKLSNSSHLIYLALCKKNFELYGRPIELKNSPARYIAQLSSISENTARRCLKELHKAKLVSIEQRPNGYEMTLPTPHICGANAKTLGGIVFIPSSFFDLPLSAPASKIYLNYLSRKGEGKEFKVIHRFHAELGIKSPHTVRKAYEELSSYGLAIHETKAKGDFTPTRITLSHPVVDLSSFSELDTKQNSKNARENSKNARRNANFAITIKTLSKNILKNPPAAKKPAHEVKNSPYRKQFDLIFKILRESHIYRSKTDDQIKRLVKEALEECKQYGAISSRSEVFTPCRNPLYYLTARSNSHQEPPVFAILKRKEDRERIEASQKPVDKTLKKAKDVFILRREREGSIDPWGDYNRIFGHIESAFDSSKTLRCKYLLDALWDESNTLLQELEGAKRQDQEYLSENFQNFFSNLTPTAKKKKATQSEDLSIEDQMLMRHLSAANPGMKSRKMLFSVLKNHRQTLLSLLTAGEQMTMENIMKMN